MTSQHSFWKRFPQKAHNFFIIVISCCIAGLLLYGSSQYVSVQEIQVTGLLEGQTLLGTGQLKGSMLPLLSSSQVMKQLSDMNHHLKIISVSKQYPHTLNILVNPLQYEAALEVESGYFLMNEDGLLIARTKKNSDIQVPIIHLYQLLTFTAYQPGDTISFSEIQLALIALKITQSLGLVPIRVDIDSSHVLALHTSESEFRLTSEKDTDVQIYQLKAIVEEMRKQGKTIRLLDLRFDKPIVQFK